MGIRRIIQGTGIFLTLTGLGLLLALVVRATADYRKSTEKGRIASTIVRQQLIHLADGSSVESEAVLQNEAGWPDDFLTLQRWLIAKTLHGGRSPAAVAAGLEKLSAGHSFSTTLSISLSRWKKHLNDWEKHELSRNSTSQEEYTSGIQRYMEAVGYQKIGRGYDASVLYLESISLLTQFIENAPNDIRVPEGLYFLGSAYLGIRHALDLSIRADRILNLCSELYPSSIWAKQATTQCSEENNNGS